MNELQDINEQMGRIANLARAYANASPEQRSNVNREDIQAQLDRYNELKTRRNELYAEQEARVQAELEAQRQAQQQQINTRGTWRIYKWNWGNGWNWRGGGRIITQEQVAPSAGAFPVATNVDWTIRYSDWTNRNADWSIHDYSKDQSYVPWMSVNPAYVNNNNQLSSYDERYDVNSPNYVYNKTTTNWKWQTSALPEFADSYGKYDAWGRLVSQDVLDERAAYQDTLNMPWEKITWLNNIDLLTAAAPMAWEIVNSIRWLNNIPVIFTRWWTAPAWSLWQVNNYLGQANNYLWRVNNFLTENPWVTYNNIQRARKTYDALAAPALSNNVTTPTVQYVSPILNSVSSAYRPVSLF